MNNSKRTRRVILVTPNPEGSSETLRWEARIQTRPMFWGSGTTPDDAVAQLLGIHYKALGYPRKRDRYVVRVVHRVLRSQAEKSGVIEVRYRDTSKVGRSQYRATLQAQPLTYGRGHCPRFAIVRLLVKLHAQGMSGNRHDYVIRFL